MALTLTCANGHSWSSEPGKRRALRWRHNYGLKYRPVSEPQQPTCPTCGLRWLYRTTREKL